MDNGKGELKEQGSWKINKKLIILGERKMMRKEKLERKKPYNSKVHLKSIDNIPKSVIPKSVLIAFF